MNRNPSFQRKPESSSLVKYSRLEIQAPALSPTPYFFILWLYREPLSSKKRLWIRERRRRAR
jgi:hypothetical protein